MSRSRRPHVCGSSVVVSGLGRAARWSGLLALVAAAAFARGEAGIQPLPSALPPAVATPFSDAAPILRALRDTFWPNELRGWSGANLEAAWPAWVAARDAAIRERIEQGEEESVIHLLLYGTAFTSQPLVREPDMAGFVSGGGEPPDSLRARIEDFVAALSTGASERLEFARDVVARQGMDPRSADGRGAIRRYLFEGARRLGASSSASLDTIASDPTAESLDRRTLFRERGLTFNTSIFVNLAIEEALTALRDEGVIAPRSVRRVGIVGAGLEFTEKQDGYDFYAPQTIQPFAVIDSARRLGLVAPDGMEVVAFDLNPRVLGHVEAARRAARTGDPYALVLPRNLDRQWTPALLAFWERFGDRIGEGALLPAVPALPRMAARRVLVRPPVVLSVVPRDLNIVLERLEPASDADRFDLILATNILVYYGVFEQSLAAVNVARMLRPGGLFLSNDRIFELPALPVASIGYTDVNYMELPGIGGAGDRIVWYKRN